LRREVHLGVGLVSTAVSAREGIEVVAERGPGEFFGELDSGAGFGYARLATVTAAEPRHATDSTAWRAERALRRPRVRGSVGT
jgi:hypothetical protein